MDEATIVKALLDHNLVLGEIKGIVNSVKDLQTTANSRTEKLENRITAVEKENDTRLVDLETAKKVADGQLRIVKWVGSVLIIIIGIIEPVIIHYWPS